MTTTIKRRTPRQAFDLWVKALRSGKYKQTQGQLKGERIDGKSGDGFCCLGVLCDLTAKDGGLKFGDRYTLNGEKVTLQSDAGYPPPKVTKFLGIDDTIRGELADMNDDGKSFKRIASWLEKHRDRLLAGKFGREELFAEKNRA